MSDGRPGHHFTVDVEEFFHASALERWVPRHSWEGFQRRSPRILPTLLDFLESRDTKGTFFVVGWLAEREPSMVKAIAHAGHEIGSHSWYHCRVPSQSIGEFRESVRRSKQFLEDLTGQPVEGFRAPSWSIVPGVEWALEVLVEEGYRYDSSLFPIRHHPSYGYPGTIRDPHWLDLPSGRIAEIPPSTLRRLGVTLPAAGGAYLRLLPYGMIEGALLDAERRSQPGTFYVHTWELDPYVPDIGVSAVAHVRTFGGVHRVWPRLERLFREFHFQRVASTVRALEATEPPE